MMNLTTSWVWNSGERWWTVWNGGERWGMMVNDGERLWRSVDVNGGGNWKTLLEKEEEEKRRKGKSEKNYTLYMKWANLQNLPL